MKPTKAQDTLPTWLIDSHSKGNRGTQYTNFPVAPIHVPLLSFFRTQISVVVRYLDGISSTLDEFFLESFGKLFAVFSAQTINDTGGVLLVFALVDNVIANGIIGLVILLADLVVQIGPIKTRSVQVAISFHSQCRNGIVDDLLVCSGRQCHEWYVWKIFTQ